MTSNHEHPNSNHLPSSKRAPPPQPPPRRILPSQTVSPSQSRAPMPSSYLMNDIPRGTARPRLMNSLLTPSHIPSSLNTDIRPDVFCGVTITDSRLDDELSVATIEFSDTPQWLQAVSLDPRGFPKYTEFGTLWRDVNRTETDDTGRTAFINAVINGGGTAGLLYAEMLAEFADTDVNVQDDTGRTALHWASEAGLSNMVKLCLSVPDCVIGLKDHDGLTAFDIALTAADGDDTIPALFYQSMLELEQIDPQAALLRVLTVTSVPAEDRPVFPGAAIFGPIEDRNQPLVQALVDRGVDLGATNEDGETALQVAVRVGDLHVARLLVDSGIDLAAEDSRGRTVLELTEENPVEGMVQLLIGTQEVAGGLLDASQSEHGDEEDVLPSSDTPLAEACPLSALAPSCGVLKKGDALGFQDRQLIRITCDPQLHRIFENMRPGVYAGIPWRVWDRCVSYLTTVDFHAIGHATRRSDKYRTDEVLKDHTILDWDRPAAQKYQGWLETLIDDEDVLWLVNTSIGRHPNCLGFCYMLRYPSWNPYLKLVLFDALAVPDRYSFPGRSRKTTVKTYIMWQKFAPPVEILP